MLSASPPPICANASALQISSQWSNLITKEVIESEAGSVELMKKVTAIAISTITYLKKIFPEECYTSFELEELRLQVLNEDCDDEDAVNTCVALKNAFIALEKKFLHKLVLCLFNGPVHVDNLVESYTFEYSYKNGVSVAVRTSGLGNSTHEAQYSADRICERTLHLFKACVVTSWEEPAEGSVYNLGLRLYYNEGTPEEYHTPGFRPEESNENDLQEYAEFSSISTPFHRVGASIAFMKSHASCSVNISPDIIPTFTEEDIVILSDANEAEVKCACSKEDFSELMLTCKFCGTLQHAGCYGFASTAATCGEHCCVTCTDIEPSRTPTCPKLAAATARKRTPLCLFRRTVRWVHGARPRRLQAAALAARFSLSHDEVRSLMKALHRSNILGQHDDVQVIDYDEVDRAINHFFRREEENTVVERLFAESLSQSEAPDPVSQMLHPSEQMSLQQATTVGQVVQRTPPHSIQEDPILKQYRDAIFSAEDTTNDEFPLSGTHNPIKNIGETKASKRKVEEPEKDENRLLKSQQRKKKLCLKRFIRKT